MSKSLTNPWLSSDRLIPFISGSLMSLNFILFWAIPIAGMGSLYKKLLKPYLQPLFYAIDGNKLLRSFATNYIYTKPEHSDYFTSSLLIILNCSVSISTVFLWQMRTGHLPLWLVFAYYCSWVGLGGTIMGSAYSLAHREGHYHGLYKKWIRDSIGGRFFENYLGVFFGNVPYNFTTSHVFIHHRLDGGVGDTFYEWDFDRSSLPHFMLYIHRIFLHMIGYSSIKFFNAHGQQSKAKTLTNGILIYWSVGLAILLITRSPRFVWFIFLEPLLCMTYFLALMNIGFHGFVEFDQNGKSIPYVNATTIVDGEDDFFGEDDHMAHHYHSQIYFRDLPQHQLQKREEFKQVKASVFQKISIVELSIFILLRLWDKLADHYVDYTEKMSREEVITMLKQRLQRCETSYEVYQKYLQEPTPENRNNFTLNTSNNIFDKPEGKSD